MSKEVDVILARPADKKINAGCLMINNIEKGFDNQTAFGLAVLEIYLNAVSSLNNDDFKADVCSRSLLIVEKMEQMGLKVIKTSQAETGEELILFYNPDMSHFSKGRVVMPAVEMIRVLQIEDDNVIGRVLGPRVRLGWKNEKGQEIELKHSHVYQAGGSLLPEMMKAAKKGYLFFKPQPYKAEKVGSVVDAYIPSVEKYLIRLPEEPVKERDY